MNLDFHLFAHSYFQMVTTAEADSECCHVKLYCFTLAAANVDRSLQQN